jgi:acetyl esterase/lipase
MKKSRALTVLSALVATAALGACSSNSGTHDPTTATSAGSGAASPAAASSSPKVTHSYVHVTEDTTYADIIDNPAFAGFGKYMAPTEDAAQTAGLKALTIKQLLPAVGWHDGPTIAEGYNFMIDEVNAGEQMWHPLYSAADVAADPTKDAAGLWFIPGDAGKPLAVVAAGGAFRAVESMQESFPLAQLLHEQGYNVAILKYRVDSKNGQGKGGQGQMSPAEQHADEDMVAAMKLLKDNAGTWKINFDTYSVWGSSAGGMIVSQWAADGPNSAKANNFPEPATVVNAYTPAQELTPSALLPPYFITDAADDKTVSPAGVAKFAADLKAAGGVVEFERYPTGGHGFGIGTGTSAAGWTDKAIAFWQSHMAS